MSDFMDEIKAELAPRSRSPKLDAAYAAMSAEQGKDLLEALADESVPSAAIARVLTRRGHTIGYKAIQAARENGWRPNESE